MAKQRVPRTRGGKRYTESQYLGMLRSAVRRRFMTWPVRSDALKDARRVKNKRKKGRHKFEYECAECHEWFQVKEVQVDHIEAAGGFRTAEQFGVWAFAIMCEKKFLQILCKVCHALKTKAEREERKK